MTAEADYPIDFVITWVDDGDPAWLAEKRQYQGDMVGAAEIVAGDDRDVRFRDWDLLRYWFRGVERFTPWVRTVHFVTWGHLPTWLDTTHPKLHVVNHRDFIPEKYLPTFSSHTIEWNVHRIPGLAERFVYFNDDTFLLKETCPEVFFKNGLPCGAAVHTPLRVSTLNWFFVPMSNTAVLNDHFSQRACIISHPGKWLNPIYGTEVLRTVLMLPYSHFFGMKEDHLPHSFLRSTFEEVWRAEPALLDRTCGHTFRCNTDVNQWLVEWWQYCEGNFAPRSPKVGKNFEFTVENPVVLTELLVTYITNQKGNLVCVNDGVLLNDFNGTKEQIAAAFESILPERSAFELDDV